MALQRLSLRTHERYAVFGRALHDAIEAMPEHLGRTESVVADAPVVVTDGIVGAATQFQPEEDVRHSVRGERICQRLAVELWVKTAAGHRADIRYCGDTVALQQINERLQWMRRVTNRQHSLASSSHHFRFSL